MLIETAPDLTDFEKPVRSVLVLGLGNPILRDDGVGWRVVEELARSAPVRAPHGASTNLRPYGRTTNVEFDCVALGGLALMERLIGYEHVVLVDAIQTRDGAPGMVYQLGLDDLPTLNADAVHDASLVQALELGRRLGATLPDDITIIAIEAADLLDFGEGLTPGVEAAVPQAVALVLEALDQISI